MKYLKKFNTEPKDSINEELEEIHGKIEKYQKLFEKAYAKNDKANCKKYDKILIDLHQKL